MSRHWAVLVLAVFFLPVTDLAGQEKGTPVRAYDMEVEINEHNQLPLDPYPPFGLVTGYICYPNPFYGSKYFQVTRRKLKILAAENEYLQFGICPEYGGRVWFLYDKIRKREVIHRVYTDAKFYNAGMGYQYVSGGLELNLPNAHSQTNARPRDCVSRANPDGSVTLTMSNTEKIGRLRWSVSFTLMPAEARIRQEVRVANETPVEARYLYWANCGIPLDENTEYVFPENRGAMHGKYQNEYSWPEYEGANLGLIRNVDEMLGLYMLDAREGFFGYYNHGEHAGMAHYADPRDVPGKKYWSWGWDEYARHTALTHTDGKPYGEVQAGRIVIQEKFDRILPLSSSRWTEYWYPIGDIGVFNGASENAAIRFVTTKTEKGGIRAEARIQANRLFTDVRIRLKNGGRVVRTIPVASLVPEKAMILEEEIPAGEADSEQLSLDIEAAHGVVIGSARSKAEKPRPFDSYLTPEKLPLPKADDFTAEGIFARAEALQGDWFFHLPEIVRLLEESLRIDPGFSRAHGELGLIALQAGNFNEALNHFNQALKRIPDDGRIHYYKGLCLRYLGKSEEAISALRYAGRFGYEAQERIAEAEIAISGNRYEEALRQLDRAVALSPDLLRGRVLKAMTLNRMLRKDAARQELEAAAAIDPENALLSCCRLIIGPEDSVLRNTVLERYARFPEEILEATALLVHSGFFPEARETLDLISRPGSLVRLYREGLDVTPDKKEQASLPGKEDSSDFAWRMEEFLLLQKLMDRSPKAGEWHARLGDFLYGHGQEREGIAEWEKSYALGFRNKISLYSLYRAKKKIGDPADDGYRYLLEASALDRSDPYLFDDSVAEIRKRKGIAEEIRTLEAGIGRFRNCFITVNTLMEEYLRAGEYGKLEKYASGLELGDFWRFSLGRNWQLMKMALGYRLLKDKKYREALAEFEIAESVPANIERHFISSRPLRARRLFYMGYCRDKLGDRAAAEKSWEEALKILQNVQFEASNNFALMEVRYFQAFCLRGLKRFSEAEVYVKSIKEFAGNTSIYDLPEESKRHLLDLAHLGRETDIDRFDRFDTELGITTSSHIRTSVED